jgi:hypothetical protein
MFNYTLKIIQLSFARNGRKIPKIATSQETQTKNTIDKP